METMMTIDQKFADLLYAQWKLLWPLPPLERIKYIEELRLDYVFEAQLEAVSNEMMLS